MANNIQLDAGTGGSTLATEQNGSAEHYQKIKITDGTATAFTNSAAVTAGSALKVDNSGVVQPINDNGGSITIDATSLPLPTGAATSAKQPALGTAGSASTDVLTVQGAASMTKLLVTPDLPSGASTAAKQPALGTAGTASSDVLSVQGIASMTALKVDGSAVTQPVSGTVTTTPPSNASTNLAQVAGTTADTNSGTKSAGTLRVVLATDQPALTNKLLVTPDSVALPANQSTNVSQINAVTPLMGNGTTGTGSQRVTIASDNTAFSVNATLQAGSAVVGHVINDASSAVIGHVIADSGSTTAVTGTVAVTESGTWTVQPGNTANTTPWLSTNVPPASGSLGWSFSYQSALAATKAQIKATAGTFGGYVMLTNPNTAETYIQIFNKASASVTVGTTAPDFVLRIPGLATASGTGIAANLEIVNGVAMSTGITVAATTTATGSTGPTNAVTGTFLFA